MEQKKILWIIAAVGVFLLIVLGTACILYSPGKNNAPVIASVAPVEKRAANSQSGWTGANTDLTGNLVPPAPVTVSQDVVKAEANEVIVYTENATIYETNPRGSESSGSTTIDLNALKETSLQPQNINVNVTVKKDDVEVKRETVESVNQTSVEKQQTSVTTASSKQPAPKTEEKKATKVPAATTKTNTAKSASSKPAPAKIEEAKKVQYWVQVAAYSNKKGAEEARDSLDANKIPADIFTYRDNKDRLFYRVRVGPYTTKSEAEYWRQKIEATPEFKNEGSYITAN